MPFSLATAAQFRADPPPNYGSEESYTDTLGVVSTNHKAYVDQLNEVVKVGARLSDEQKSLVEYWADGPRTPSIPGHWNRIAQGVVERDDLSLGETTQLFFALNATMLDAGIAAWDTKRWFDYIRPVSAINALRRGQTITGWAGPNRGNASIPGEQWIPYQELNFVTPAFPGYVSSQSVFSRAASEVLTLFTLRSVFYDGKTQIAHDHNLDGVGDKFGEYIVEVGGRHYEEGPARPVVLRWNSFHEAAQQAGRSRIYAGTQFQDSDLRGQEMGRLVGRQSFCKAQEYFDNETYEKLCFESNRRSFNTNAN